MCLTDSLKYTKGITDATGFNEDYTPSGGVAAKTAWVKILDKEAYNVNHIKPIDLILEKCLRYHVLENWFLLKDLDTDAAKFAVAYKKNLNRLLKQSMQLKKVSVA